MAMAVPFLVSGGSATELSVTGAWLKAAALPYLQNLRQFAAAVCIGIAHFGPTMRHVISQKKLYRSWGASPASRRDFLFGSAKRVPIRGC